MSDALKNKIEKLLKKFKNCNRREAISNVAACCQNDIFDASGRVVVSTVEVYDYIASKYDEMF